MTKHSRNGLRLVLFVLIASISAISLIKLHVTLQKPSLNYEIELVTDNYVSKEVTEVKQACVVVNNPRTSAIYASNLLHYYGSEYVFTIRSTIRGCDAFRREENDAEMPLVKLSFQKEVEQHLKLVKDLKNVFFFIQGDEYCKLRRREVFDSRITVTQYYDSDTSLYSIPIGPRKEIFEFFKIHKSDWTKKFFFNFIGSLTNKDRYVLQHHIKSSNQIAEFQHFVKFFEKWNDQDVLSSTDFAAVLASSVFTLCPMGHNAETFRLFEAIEANSIPIVAISPNYRTHPCQNSLKPYLNAINPFLVVLNDWNELSSTLKYYRERPEEITKLQRNIQVFRREFWEKKAVTLDCVLNRHCQVDLRNSLITGCGRSGTFSVFKFLSSVGVPAVHEGFRKGAVSVSWLYAAEDEAYPFEFPIQRKRRLAFERELSSKAIFKQVFLLVRHPLKVISSIRRCFCGTGSRNSHNGAKAEMKSWTFIERHLKLSEGDYDSVERAARYWVEWNRLVMERFGEEVVVLRLEELTPEVLLKKLGRSNRTELPSEIVANKLHVSKTKLRPDVTLEELQQLNRSLANEIVELAREFGYLL